MPNIGPMEIGIVLIIALIVFGPKKLPDLGHSLGKGLREFKGSLTGDVVPPAPPLGGQAAPVAEVAPAVPVTQMTREHEKTPVA
jgi:sec-independent protein translocase protein TatA